MRLAPILMIFCSLFLASCTATTTPNKLGTADAPQGSPTAGQLEIPVGTAASRISQLLGPADVIDTGEEGQLIWRYSNKRADYVYFSNANNTQALVLSNYSADIAAAGLPLQLTLVFSPAGKLIDFTFAQIGF